MAGKNKRNLTTSGQLQLPILQATSVAVLRGFLFILFISCLAIPLYAQDAPAEEEPYYEEEIVRLPASERQRIEMEIRTSTLSELAVWCRTLGLSESGTREDLSRRIRDHFNIPEPRAQNNDNRKVITIDSAQTTEYFSIDVIGEDYARLKGDVKISLKDGDTVHRISADEILFNRTRNILTAKGQVVYEKVEADSIETFRGENITVNIDNWSSVFLDGNSERKLESDGTAYLFSGKVISRSDEDVTILNNAEISSAYNEEALWSIRASKLWLLPGSDFAILNAVLKVGEIPLLYIPFFYFPGDELVFHPVIGFRSREGGFIQTTTYLIGQPKADPAEASSITRILGNSNDKEKELHGLFLRSTGKKIVNPNTASLKLLLDHYVNLGTYIGLDLAVPKKGMLNPLDLTLGVGFTRTVTMLGDNYTPYLSNDEGFFDGNFDWNHSNFFSELVPFRYRIKFQSSITGRYGGLFWNLPYYSDPYVDRDFLNRAESMDWMNMIQQGAALDETALSQSEIGEYRWHVNGNLNPSLPALSPYISRVAISNISTTLSFRTIRDNEIFANNRDAPGRFFYAPDKLTIYSISGSVSGTPVTIGTGQQRPARTVTAEEKDPFDGIGTPISPWIIDETVTERQPSTEILVPPILTQTFSLPQAGNMRFNIDYQISPTGASELQFMNSKWSSYDQVDWGEVQTILTNVSGNSNINFRTNHTSGFFNNTLTLSGSGTWRDYNYINDEAYSNQDEIDRIKKQQYSQTNYSTSYSHNTTIRPLYRNSIFSQSNLQYSFGGTLVRSKRYADSMGPELTPEWGSWVKEDRNKEIYGLTSHRLSSNFEANIMDKRQNITLSTELPPLNALVSTNATFRVWISETNINFRLERPDPPAGEEQEWIFRPIYFTETLRFAKSNMFSYYMVMNPEEDYEITTIRTTLTLWNLRAEFTALKTQRSVFNLLEKKWEMEGEPTLLPKDFTASYNQSSTNIEIIKNRLNLTFNINTSLKYDLQQYTNSNFQVTSSFLLNINGLLELRLSSSTINPVIWRYFKNFPGMEEKTNMYPEGPQNNLITDLLDSFNFLDESKRKRSGFKMQRFDLSAVHFLGDWKAELRVGMFPYQNIATRAIEYTTDVSFLVQWAPITEIKSDIKYDGRNERWTLK